ncbi:hypothetical protein TBLA_0D02870 [Henningerozyma blattae CBS 6284]|uniref:Uncharacterized protein n=1 Tax=Henningerozyma blattae (strain ATCC 34711 / CBS 6284 / DSM 70876 / NBRC 10599 / NRRL Y-10934 / UCD 77-7) TaxID=1071380 RepID=I2H336_HENB6|nr:hypothetical protein TBLA_0D02870 [Tetrapisispora blattae CBS 6284]CCH60788.1 hypothetical protein TBLA_0D02870 [Tetrapisispora blattae CBS 6284]
MVSMDILFKNSDALRILSPKKEKNRILTNLKRNSKAALNRLGLTENNLSGKGSLLDILINIGIVTSLKDSSIRMVSFESDKKDTGVFRNCYYPDFEIDAEMEQELSQPLAANVIPTYEEGVIDDGETLTEAEDALNDVSNVPSQFNTLNSINTLINSYTKTSLYSSRKGGVSDVRLKESEIEDIILGVIEFNELIKGRLNQEDVNACNRLCVFFTVDMPSSIVSEKLIDVIFLDGTHLAGKFQTLLTLVATTTENRSYPIAHMLVQGGEKYREARQFLWLTKKYVPLSWDRIQVMCDQSRALESAITSVMDRPYLTCGVHLVKNVVKWTKGKVVAKFRNLLHTLDEATCNDNLKCLVQAFYSSAKANQNSTYNKITSMKEKFATFTRKNHFEQFSTNPVEQFHSLIKMLKRTGTNNLINNLLANQGSCINTLVDENWRTSIEMTNFGICIISCQLALASCFEVISKPSDHDVYTLQFVTKTDIKKMYEAYMRTLGRKANYTDSRYACLKSLKNCGQPVVVKGNYCSLCPSPGYYYCPHVFATKLFKHFPSIYEGLQCQPILQDLNLLGNLNINVKECIEYFGIHSVLYR